MVATQTKISLSLDAADTTIMHCVGMTGLYMTLKRLEKQYPSSRQRGGHISWSLTADTIELFWQGSDFVALSWLIKESFQLDDTGLIHLTGLDNDGIDLRQKIHIHEGICAVFLRLNKFYQAGKIINTEPEMLNPNTKLYIFNYSNSKKPKIVNMTSSPQTNEHN